MNANDVQNRIENYLTAEKLRVGQKIILETGALNQQEAQKAISFLETACVIVKAVLPSRTISAVRSGKWQNLSNWEKTKLIIMDTSIVASYLPPIACVSGAVKAFVAYKAV